MEERKLSIEDLENSIDILGIKFDVEFSEEYIDRLKKINVKDIEKDENVFNQLKEMMNIILNDKEGYKKIKDKYYELKHKELGIQGFLKIWEFIFKEYSKEFNNMKQRNMNVDIPKIENRENRRYRKYNKNYRRNNYRRY